MTVAFGKKRIFSLSFHLLHTLYERLLQRKNNFSPHIYYLPNLSKKTVFSLSLSVFLALFFLVFRLFLTISCTSMDSSQYRFSGHLRHCVSFCHYRCMKIHTEIIHALLCECYITSYNNHIRQLNFRATFSRSHIEHKKFNFDLYSDFINA